MEVVGHRNPYLNLRETLSEELLGEVACGYLLGLFVECEKSMDLEEETAAGVEPANPQTHTHTNFSLPCAFLWVTKK